MATLQKQPDRGRLALFKLYVATSLLHLPVLALYESERRMGLLPSEEVWSRMGGNHGPWWDNTFILLSIFGFLLLPVLTTLLTIAATFWSKRAKPLTFLAGLALVFFQCWAGIALLSRISWTID